MGRYNRKSQRHSWDENNMKQAILAVREKRMGWLLASKTFDVPFTTLRRRAAKTEGWKKDYMGGHRVTFDQDLEKEIVEHLKNLESRFFGLTTTDVRKLAYEVAEAKKIRHRFSSTTKMAGWDWLRGFRQRNPSITLRIPESTSAARASAFNKNQIGEYFAKLSETIEAFKFEANDIWNVDESGLSTVPSRNSKIFATKGRKQVGVLTSAERGQHLTVTCCMNPVGTFVPPALIFPRKNMKNEIMDGAPVESVGFTQENGWMNGEVFLKWMKHFVKFVKPTKEKKVLLLLDGHSSHKSLDVMMYAKESGIVMFCFPPHCTHRVQPLDISFYGPLRTYYNQALNNWLRNHPGRTVTHFQVASLFNEAYIKAATIKTAQNGFSTTGIYPFNADVFPEYMFAPAEVTNIHKTTEDGENLITRPSTSTTQPFDEDSGKPVQEHPEVLVGTEENGLNISVQDISPLPVTTQTERVQRRKGKYGFLNTTPEIQTAKLLVAEKAAKVLRKSARATKKRVFADETGENEENEEVVNMDDDEDDVACMYCNDLYSRSYSNELWVKCQLCSLWCHAECAGTGKKFKTFICDVCKA